MNNSQEAKTLGDWAKIAIHQHYQKILNHEALVLKDKDPEELHQMRVGMRRLRTAIAGFSCAVILPKSVDERKVGKIATMLGQLRDLDVLEETLTTIYLPELSKTEQKKLETLFIKIKKRRKTIAKIVKDILHKNIYQDFKKDLNTWLEKPVYTAIASLPMEHILPDLLSPQISAFLLHPGWIVGSHFNKSENMIDFNFPTKRLEDLSHHEEITLHSLRKEAKRTRYLMELLLSFYGENYQEMLKKIKQVQEVLGEIQDGFVLRQVLGQVYGHDLQKILPIMAQKIREHRLQNGLQWEELRQFFLSPDHRNQLRLSIHSPRLILKNTP
jgi:CHAD domain-containing protein